MYNLGSPYITVIPSNGGNPRTQIIPYFIEVGVNGPQYVEIPVTASSNISIYLLEAIYKTNSLAVDISKLLI